MTREVRRRAPAGAATAGADPAARAVLEACAGILPTDRVEPPPPPGAEPANAGLYRPRRLLGTLRPRTAEDVRRLTARLSAAFPGVALYPVSTGYNWGLGSAEPVCDGALLLRLDGLDRIRALDLDTGVAVIEPGVTQGRLAQAVAGSDFLVNLTTSSAHTSVVGNALERGVGVRRQRTHDLAGLEVVLADGTLVHLGHWPDAGATAPYPHGLGPSLTGLFQQSGLGVVTAATIRLLPRPEAQRVIRVRFDERVRPQAVGRLRRHHMQGVIAGVLKIYSSGASAAYEGAGRQGYTAYACVDGPAPLVGRTARWLADDLERSGLFDRPHVLDPQAPSADPAERALLGSLAGDPGHNDAMLEAIFGVGAPAVDTAGGSGWLFAAAMAPFTVDGVERACAVVAHAAGDAGVAGRPEATGAGDLTGGVVVGHTLNVLPDGCVDVVVSVRFDRGAGGTGAGATAAHGVLDRLHDGFVAAGLACYRLDIDHMPVADRWREPAEAGLLTALKDLLDPTHLLAPSRYHTPSGPGAGRRS